MTVLKFSSAARQLGAAEARLLTVLATAAVAAVSRWMEAVGGNKRFRITLALAKHALPPASGLGVWPQRQEGMQPRER